jgi:hypothetical protein
MEVEQWPLLQAYGLEGVGRSGFLTMSTKVTDSWQALHEQCYTALDRPGVAWCGQVTRSLRHPHYIVPVLAT